MATTSALAPDFKAQQKQALTITVGGAIVGLASGTVLPSGLLRMLGTAGGMAVAAYGWMKVVEAGVRMKVDDQLKMGQVVASCVAQYALTGKT